MLAYSSVSQYGLVVVGLAIGTPAAVFGAVVHLLGHAIMKGGLFVAAGTVDDLTGAQTVDEYAGLADRFPVLGGASAVLMLAMVGVPPAVGFAGKWYIALGAVRAGAWPVAVVIFASTLLTLAYFALLIERMFVAPASPSVRAATDGGEGDRPDRPSRAALALVILAAITAVALGLGVTNLQTALEPTIDTLLAT